MKTTRIGDLDLTETNETYVFIPKKQNIYEIPALFEHTMISKKKVGVIYITET